MPIAPPREIEAFSGRWCFGRPGRRALDRSDREQLSVNGALRNRLVNLLLEGFASSDAAAVRWCAACCDGSGRPPLTDPTDSLRAAAALEGILVPVIAAGDPSATRWTVHPDVLPWLSSVRERLRVYVAVLDAWAAQPRAGGSGNAAALAVAQAALCFNAALFFEAHEVLEQVWVRLPRGPRRLFLQALIQISVGFHHARRGSHDGAVNQLGKGLDKLAGVSGRVFGLECDRFLRDVAAIRDRLVHRGRGSMQPLEVAEIPRMRIDIERT
jgi:hypothetical protein